MNVYEFYLDASYAFINNPKYSELSKEERDYSNFASTLFSWLALEAYVNSLAFSLSKGSRVNKFIKLFLEEQTNFVDDTGNITLAKFRLSTTLKILFMLRYFSRVNPAQFKKTRLWTDVKNFEDLRHNLIHPKEKRTISCITFKKASEFEDLSVEMIDYLHKKILNKPFKR
ncbi:MAG: hypothetical protein WC607_04295 [Candidatus Micrarchaeia archaeon]